MHVYVSEQVTETGWGEFEIQIKIYLADPVERPVTIYHVLKLFQVPQSPSAFQYVFPHYQK